jgi:type II secretory ATPase GspE/PulE/Tfp pilus assembly ATPase PilB-like protein
VRSICKKCRTPFEPTENQLQLLNLSPHDIGDKVFYYGRGCATCNDTGYKGRKGIFEQLGFRLSWMNVFPEIRTGQPSISRFCHRASSR